MLAISLLPNFGLFDLKKLKEEEESENLKKEKHLAKVQNNIEILKKT